MQRPLGSGQSERKKTTSKSGLQGRVVDFQAWKSRKRVLERRSRDPRNAAWLRLLVMALAVASGFTALLSCIPSTWQEQSMIVCWFAATIGSALGLWLNVLRYHLAQRLLAAFVVSMATSFVAALVQVYSLPH